MTTARKVGGWRKLAGATWGAPQDPQFYGDLDVDAAAALAYIDATRRATGVHVTLTHLAVKAIGAGLQAVPGLNVRLVRGREHPRESIDVFVIVAVDRDELTGIKICDVDRKSVVEIAQEVEAHTAQIRRGEDEQLGKTKKMMTMLPRHGLKYALRLSAWLTSDRHLDLPQYGLPRDAFGSAMVSAIGATGIAHAYSPLAPYYRVPLLVLVGAVQEKPVVVAGQVVARPTLTLTATFDHRYSDGLAAADFARAMAAYLREPSAADALAPQIPRQSTPRRETTTAAR